MSRRLPIPEIVEVRVEPSEDVKEREKEFIRLLATAIRRSHMKNKKDGKKDDH
ncbi:hypothetical protein [Inediibacterium massiliense]|uniref:hypothetical protein n=1 Tax=Inediibacterium massiliense TaxID=1658111 RepID=UPI0018FE11F4|nr:hypothetical protein [Inediibacterium massiliense]